MGTKRMGRIHSGRSQRDNKKRENVKGEESGRLED